MKTKLLLPNRFKKLGTFLMPIGLLVWCYTQRFGIDISLVGNEKHLHLVNVIVLSTSFFSFIFGVYFLTFSREKEEDEYIVSLRLRSFQTAAFIQLVFFIASFVTMFIGKLEPSNDAGLELFLMGAIFLFWLSYILYFNILLVRNKRKLYVE